MKYLPSPYTSNCEDYSLLNFKFQKYERITTRGDCFNECVKKEYRLNFLFYTERDNDSFIFNTSDMLYQLFEKDKGKLVDECYEICKKRNCEFIKYFDQGYALDYVENRLLIDLEEYKADIIAKPGKVDKPRVIYF